MKVLLKVIARHNQINQNSKFVISLEYLQKKKRGIKLIFCMQINIKLSYKLIPLILVGMAKPAHITQNNKFAKSLQYFKTEVRDKFVFLCRWASQFSLNWCCHFWRGWPDLPKVLKITSIKICSIKILKLRIVFARFQERIGL